MYNITIIAGARPNFMKIAPIIHAIENAKQKGEALAYRLVHTGQHYDKNMSGSFFEQLNIPETITLGMNPQANKSYLEKLFNGEWKAYKTIPLWDGKTAERIVANILSLTKR